MGYDCFQTSYLPTMPEDYRMEAKAAIAAREPVKWFGKSDERLGIGFLYAPISSTLAAIAFTLFSKNYQISKTCF